MNWRWKSPKGPHGYQKATRRAAIEDAVGCAMVMQRGLKAGSAIDTPEPELVDVIWAGLKNSGWAIEEVTS